MSTKQPSLEEFKVDEFNLRGKTHNATGFPTSAKPAEAKSFDPKQLDTATVDRVLEMAWEDRTTFEAIEQQFGLKEKDVIATMRYYMKRSSFKMWRKRVSDRKTKHEKKREFEVGRFKSSNQKHY